MNHSALHIASLLPSATEICDQLGLADSVVGITHECDVLFTSATTDHITNYKYASIEDALAGKAVQIVTTSEIDPHSLDQGAIDHKVKESISQNLSLYTIQQQIFDRINPNVVITQQLCDVCAPSMNHLNETIAAVATKRKHQSPNGDITIVSLEPVNLLQVAESFVTVAKACHVEERGAQLKNEFLQNLKTLNSTVREAIASTKQSQYNNIPRILILEWLDPPFDAGHWVPEMISYAACYNASNMSRDERKLDLSEISNYGNDDKFHEKEDATFSSHYNHKKSKQITWDDIYMADPDCILVACCGFNTDRNVRDAKRKQEQFSKLRAYHNNRIYACDGNHYFACPGPSLLQGCYIISRVAFDNNTTAGANVVRSIDENSNLPFPLPKSDVAWKRVDFDIRKDGKSNVATDCATSSEEPFRTSLPDIENLVLGSRQKATDFYALHNSACEAQQTFYVDPQTGFHVFTEYALKQRGKCCGSGCRHCPYNHWNVVDKVTKIQQPAFLHEEWDSAMDGSSTIFSLSPNGSQHVKVLFYSGGKDSFLALRALIRERLTAEPFSLILLTTFDTSTRIIVHQDIHIDVVVHQARHLKISLVGVPLHRTTSETYEHRIRRALNAIEDRVGKKPFSLVFGDLHLDHIRHWRDVSLGLEWRLEYPLWQVPYETLLSEIEHCGVKFVISASERAEVKIGTEFTREYSNWISKCTNIDGMGESGEFHTVAQVWVVDRERALGISNP